MPATDGWDVATGPGLTALGLAASRTVESGRPDRLIDDPLAARFLGAIASPVPFPIRWPAPSERPGDQEALHLHGSRYIGLRTRHYDDLVVSATAADIEQVVLLAAGLDTRAFRLPLPADVSVYELDQPQVMAFKDDVLARADATPACRRVSVGTDLRGGWPAELTAAGFDAAVPTVWVAEGLLAYLPAEAERRLVDDVTRLSAAGSRFALDRIVDVGRLAHDASSLDRLSDRSGLEMRQLLSTQARPDVADLLRERGWAVEEQSAREVAARYGRDLSDPFAATGAGDRSEDTEPPWLDTGFVTGALPYQAARDARPSA